LALGSFTATVAWVGLGYVPGHPSLARDPTQTSLVVLLVVIFLALLIPLLWAGIASTDRYFRLPSGSGQTRRIFLIFLPLLLAALVLNLKRGPWMGVCIGGALFLALYQSRLLVPIALLVVLGYLGLEPVRQRIAEIPEHFYITGGRSMLWDIGVDLSTRFPLGVGVRNSRFLQTFSDEIPEEMNHFHNNLINITVEGGWIALCLFLWWLVSILRASFTRSTPSMWAPLLSAIGCAVISWQIAGLVEYNWGDSEVRMIVYITLGILLGVRSTPFAVKNDREPNQRPL
jgi:O-antigen ligase